MTALAGTTDGRSSGLQSKKQKACSLRETGLLHQHLTVFIPSSPRHPVSPSPSLPVSLSTVSLHATLSGSKALSGTPLYLPFVTPAFFRLKRMRNPST